ncbi:MAG TPA: DUF4405 domain-containing protein, partial [Bacteroidales bacterium]|nr:DUF4405 domain-containing protein [Bacteroidales bacterium]
MKKTNLYLLIDVLMFLFLALMSGVGLLIKYILLPGSKRWDVYGRNVDLTYLGMDRHQWGTVHLIIAILFIVALVLHIILHWKCLVNYMKRLFENKKEVNILMLAFGFILLVMIVFPFLVKVDVAELGDGRDRFLHGQGQQDNLPAAVQDKESARIKTTEDFSGKISEESVKVSGVDDSKTRSLQEAGSNEEIERHDIDADINVDGSMSLINVSVKYNVPVSHLADELDLPSNVSGNE